MNSEFNEKAMEFQRLVFDISQMKKFGRSKVDGRMFAFMVNCYTKALESGKIPLIRSAFELIIKREDSRILEQCIEEYKHRAASIEKPMDYDDLLKTHKDILHSVTQKFNNMIYPTEADNFRDEFEVKIDKCFIDLSDQNDLKSTEKCRDILATLNKSIEEKYRNGIYFSPEGYDVFKGDVENLKRHYHSHQGKGTKSKEVLNDFLQKADQISGIISVNRKMSEMKVAQAAEHRQLEKIESQKRMMEEKVERTDENARQLLQDLNAKQQTLMAEQDIKLESQHRMLTEEISKFRASKASRPEIPNFVSAPLISGLAMIASEILGVATASEYHPSNILAFKLKQFYKETTMNSIEWMRLGKKLFLKDVYINFEFEENVTLQNIFFKTSHKSKLYPQRIIVQGKPAGGKTTLCSKLAYDWANNEEYMKMFKSVFHFPVKHLKLQSLESVMKNFIKELLPEFHFELNYISDKRTLLIIDGWDDLSGYWQEQWRREFSGKKFNNFLLLITCNSVSSTELLKLSVNETDSCIIHINSLKRAEQTQFFEVKYRNHSLSKTFKLFHELDKVLGSVDRFQFLCIMACDFINGLTAGDVRGGFASNLRKIAGFFVEPVKDLAGIILGSDSEKSQNKFNLTDLFKSMINHTLNSGRSSPTAVDIVNGNNKESKKWQETLKKFGEACFNKLEKNESSHFEIGEEYTEELYNRGLLLKCKIIGADFKIKTYYECLHSSIMDFFAAYYVWRNSTANSSELNVLEAAAILKFAFDENFIAAFLRGLGGFDIPLNVLQCLQSNNFNFQENEVAFWKMLSTMADKSNVELVAQFVPESIHINTSTSLRDFYSSDFHEEIIARAIGRGNLTEICINCKDSFKFKLPTSCKYKIPKLNVFMLVQDQKPDYYYLKSLTEVSFKELNCYCALSDDLPDDLHQFDKMHYRLQMNANKFFQVFTSFSKGETKTLVCKGDSLCFWLSKNMNIVFVFFEINPVDSLECYMSKDTVKIIFLLLERDKLKSLKVILQKRPLSSQFEKVMARASSSIKLVELHVIGHAEEDICLDFHRFLTDKKWTYLHLVNLKLFCREGTNGEACLSCANTIADAEELGYHLFHCKKTLDEKKDDASRNFDRPITKLKLVL